jgi:hypothetical protein
MFTTLCDDGVVHTFLVVSVKSDTALCGATSSSFRTPEAADPRCVHCKSLAYELEHALAFIEAKKEEEDL